MQITFFSFFMSICWSSVMILCVYIIRKYNFATQKISIISIFMIYFFSLFRALVPIDIPFSRGIYLNKLFSKFYRAIYIDRHEFLGVNTNLFYFFMIVCLFVSIILFISFAIKYLITIAEINRFEKANTLLYKSVLSKVESETKKKLDVEILLSHNLNIPLGVGILKKKIILPYQIYTADELYYIILHEYTHFLNHDLLVKMFTQFYCFLFWWNPVTYLLKADLAQTLEVKCDLTVTENMTVQQKIQYLTCILNVLKKKQNKQTETFYGSVSLVTDKSNIIERFKIISNNINNPKKNKLKIFSFIVLYFIVLFISYLFVFQPQYKAPQNEYHGDDIIEITAEDNYILFENNSYYIIYGDKEKREISKDVAMQMKLHGFKIK